MPAGFYELTARDRQEIRALVDLSDDEFLVEVRKFVKDPGDERPLFHSPDLAERTFHALTQLVAELDAEIKADRQALRDPRHLVADDDAGGERGTAASREIVSKVGLAADKNWTAEQRREFRRRVREVNQRREEFLAAVQRERRRIRPARQDAMQAKARTTSRHGALVRAGRIFAERHEREFREQFLVEAFRAAGQEFANRYPEEYSKILSAERVRRGEKKPRKGGQTARRGNPGRDRK